MHDLPAAPSPATVERLRATVVAGHRGQIEAARQALADQSDLLREAALSALFRGQALDADTARSAFADSSPRVRARAAELSARIDGVDPSALLADADPHVVEVACFACGEQQWGDDAPVEQLSSIATSHSDAMCREAAAAALGAIGDPRGLGAVLAACQDRVTVRRRATLALAAFDDETADAALRRALADKDWQVRQAAEDLLEVGRSLEGDPDPNAYAD